MKQQIQWQTVILLIVVLLVLGSAYLFGPALGVPAESHTALVVGLGGLGAVALAFVKSVFAEIVKHDDDDDGLPNAFDSKAPADEATS